MARCFKGGDTGSAYLLDRAEGAGAHRPAHRPFCAGRRSDLHPRPGALRRRTGRPGVTDDYTPAGWGTGVVADTGDHEPDAGNHFKSWNRWQDHGGAEPPVEARPSEATVTEPAEDSPPQ